MLTATLLIGMQVCWAELSILRPKIGVPELPLFKGQFQVEVKAEPDLPQNGWQVFLNNDLRAWTGTVQQTRYGCFLENHSQTGYLLTVRLPADITPEVFDLKVTHPDAGTAVSRHCVKPEQSHETNFYILHYADPQVQSETATRPNGAGGRYGSVQAIKWSVPAINLINPRFVLNTGDEVNDGVAKLHPPYLEAISQLTVPLLITRGNNDCGSLTNWKRDIGQPTYSLWLGSFYIGIKDFLDNEHLAWFKRDYAAAGASRKIKFRLLGQHFHYGYASYQPPASQGPDLMLVGHVHRYMTLVDSPYHILASHAAWHYGACSFFEFRRTKKGWDCPLITQHGVSNSLTLYGDWGKPSMVSCEFQNLNDGSAVSNTAMISNRLNHNFWDGRLRFLMPRNKKGYVIEGGRLLAAYDYPPANQALLVQVDIQPLGTNTVIISPAP